MCTDREKYLYRRLMELACIAETRPLELIEKEEELCLEEELKLILEAKK